MRYIEENRDKFEISIFVLVNFILILGIVVLSDFNFLSEQKEADCPEIKYSFPDIEIEDSEKAHRILRPNVSSKVDQGMGGCGIEPYNLETNSKGWRYDEFESENPSNTTRIIIIGDSNVAGWGINSSDTFSSVLESKLDSRGQENFEVINMGVPGAGIENHYKILKNIGLTYNPDLAIVSTGDRDSMTIPKQRQLREEAKEDIPDVEQNQQSIHEEVERLNRRYWDNFSFEESVMPEYIDSMNNLSKQEDFSLCIHFLYYPRDYSSRSYIEEKAEEEENLCFIDKSSELVESSESWNIAPHDPHYNPDAHNVIAENIYQNLNPDMY